MPKKRANGSSLNRSRDLARSNKAKNAKRRAARYAKERRDPIMASRREAATSHNVEPHHQVLPSLAQHAHILRTLGLDPDMPSILKAPFGFIGL